MAKVSATQQLASATAAVATTEATTTTAAAVTLVAQAAVQAVALGSSRLRRTNLRVRPLVDVEVNHHRF
jgi:hypothetical protein